jgi:GDPmannose 4,6-dehydratase
MHSVREFAELAFREVGITIAWRGCGADETGIDAATRRVLVKVDPRYVRPTEVDHLISDPSKARQKLGWRHTVSFKELVSEMVQADMKKVKMEARRRNRSE